VYTMPGSPTREVLGRGESSMMTDVEEKARQFTSSEDEFVLVKGTTYPTRPGHHELFKLAG
jgi:phage protein U